MAKANDMRHYKNGIVVVSGSKEDPSKHHQGSRYGGLPDHH